MNKHFLKIWIVGITFLLAGCLDTVEEITIKEDGSGTYHVGMDMKGLFDMMDMIKGMDTTSVMEGTGKAKEKMDTTIYMRQFTDTASHLTAEEKALMRDGKVKLVMNEQKREFKMDLNFPFAKIEAVEKLMQLGAANGGSQLLGNAMGGNRAAEGSAGAGLPALNDFFEVAIKKNLLERKVNKEKYEALLQNESLKGMQENGDLLTSIKFNTVIHLPRPAKKTAGTNISVSPDKKTVKLSGTLQDLYQNPQAFAYRIEY